MITTLANSLVAAFNRAQPGSLPAMFASIQLGTQIRQKLHAQLRDTALTVDPYGPASNTSIFLPDDCKAAAVATAYARAGTGTVGPLVADAGFSTGPAAGHVGVGYDGNIIFHAADAWTSVDVTYRPECQDCVEATLPCVSGVVTLPPGLIAPYVNAAGVAQPGGAVTLMEAQRADTSTAQLIVTAMSATNTTTGTACFDLAKAHVLLDSADGATSVRVKLGIVSAVDLNALLEAASSFI